MIIPISSYLFDFNLYANTLSEKKYAVFFHFFFFFLIRKRGFVKDNF